MSTSASLLLSMASAALATASVSVHAGTVSATVTDKSGAAMANVVVFATPVGPSVPPLHAPETATIVQEELQFKPYVTVVRTGTAIRFPNNDKIEHHVKSFSPAKKFEYKVYDKGTPPPVVFDKPGLVVTYCLLHGWMRSYVMVVDTPYFARSDATGDATLDGLPDGTYEIKAWHPDMGSIKPLLTQTIKVAGGGQPLAFNFDFVPRKSRSGK